MHRHSHEILPAHRQAVGQASREEERDGEGEGKRVKRRNPLVLRQWEPVPVLSSKYFVCFEVSLLEQVGHRDNCLGKFFLK